MITKKSTKFFIVTSICIVLIFLPGNAFSARILGFFPTPTKSHLLVHCSIAETLAKAGHEVTVLGGPPNVYQNSTYRYINLEASGYVPAHLKELVNKPVSLYKKITSMLGTRSQWANESLSSPKMQKFLKENGEGSFDLLILGYYMNEFHLGLGAHFKCPMIISLTAQPVHSMHKLIGNPSEISYVPITFSNITSPMSFGKRVHNFFSNLLVRYFVDGAIASNNMPLYEHHFPASKYPPFKEVIKNVSLIFTNHHSPSQGPIRPNVPALIEIGGIQIKEKNSPLPQEIAVFLNNAKEGTIYFSLGTYIDGTAISESIAKAIFNVLSKLPYKVLWKWSDSVIPGTSKNIMFKNWLPQDDILAHPNIKLFITHGGLGSIVESQYHGVPMVVIPLFGDQPYNADNVKLSGFGLKLDYATLTEEKFSKAILEVLKNPKYTKAVKAFSKLYRDRPMSPRQLVTFWTEYVLRHNGAKHLQSPALELNTFQLLSLDVIGFLVTILCLITFILVKCCKALCCRRKDKSQYRAKQKKIN